MTTYTSLVYDAGAGIELVRRVSAVPSGAQGFTRCVVSSTGHLWTYAAGVWSDQGPAAPSIGGGSSSIVTASVPFTDGDTWRRVTVSDAALSSTSKIVASITRANTADSADAGLTFVPTVVSRGSGTCDVTIACVGWGHDDPVGLVNETVTLTLLVG